MSINIYLNDNKLKNQDDDKKDIISIIDKSSTTNPVDVSTQP